MNKHKWMIFGLGVILIWALYCAETPTEPQRSENDPAYNEQFADSLKPSLSQPKDNLASDSRKITFQWNSLPDVRSYHLQVLQVKETETESQSVPTTAGASGDTLVYKNISNVVTTDTTLDLESGSYCWHVRSQEPEGPWSELFSLRIKDMPHIEVDSDSLDFGEVIVNESDTLSLAIINSGKETLTIERMNILNNQDGVYTLIKDTAQSFEIVPDSSQTVQVVFTPVDAISYTAVLEIASNDPDTETVTVALSGTGTVAPLPDISVTPESISFGEVTVGQTASTEITMTNNGTAELTVNGLTLSDENSVFNLAADAPQSFTLEPGAKQTVIVEFAPTAATNYNASLAIQSNDQDESEITIELTGTGTAAPVPDISVTPESISFGEVTMGQTASTEITIANSGTAELTVNGLTLSDENSVFSLAADTPQSFTLESGAKQTVIVEFAPAAATDYNASLAIQSNDPDKETVTVALSGTGSPPPEPKISVNPETLSFGTVRVGDATDSVIVISNTGDADLEIKNVLLAGAQVFSILEHEDDTKTVLKPDESRNIAIQYKPTEEKTLSAALTIKSNAAKDSVLVVDITGSGGNPQIAVDPRSIDFGDINKGDKSSQSLKIENSGTVSLTIESFIFSDNSQNAFQLSEPFEKFSIAPASTDSSIAISFTPPGTGSFSAKLHIESNDPDSGSVSIDLTGTGVVPVIRVEPTDLGFGEVAVGETKQETVIISNQGNGKLFIENPNFNKEDADFVLSNQDDLPVKIESSKSFNLLIEFTPKQVGDKKTKLVLKSNDETNSEIEILLNGTGIQTSNPVIGIAPSALDFDLVFVGAPKTLVLTLHKKGDGDLNITDIELTGMDANFFELVENTKTPFSVSSKGTKEIQITFSPDDEKEYSAQLEITSNASNNPKTVDLKGSGVLVSDPVMQVVESGSFNMGALQDDPFAEDDETPSHDVSLSGFSISRTEITNAQFTKFLNQANNSETVDLQIKQNNGIYIDNNLLIDLSTSTCQIEYFSSSNYFYPKDDKNNYPAILVTWYGAKAFCKFYNGRLPTEAEWEYAARGGAGSQGYIYSGSNNLDEVGWYTDNSNQPTYQIRQKNPNELELYDMSGNVWEWCADWYNENYYSDSPGSNPPGPENGQTRVIRGGSRFDEAAECRVTNRKSLNPTGSTDTIGFRFAKDLEEQSK